MTILSELPSRRIPRAADPEVPAPLVDHFRWYFERFGETRPEWHLFPFGTATNRSDAASHDAEEGRELGGSRYDDRAVRPTEHFGRPKSLYGIRVASEMPTPWQEKPNK